MEIGSVERKEIQLEYLVKLMDIDAYFMKLTISDNYLHQRRHRAGFEIFA